MKKRTSTLITLLCACALLRPLDAAAQGSTETSLDEALRSLFARSPAFRTYEVETKEASASEMIASGAFDVVAGTGVQARRSLWTGPYGALTTQGYDDLSVQGSLTTQLRENVSLQLTGSAPIVGSIGAALSPDQPIVGASVTIPLLKLGRSASLGAAERAASLHAAAAGELQRDLESDLTSRVTEAFWLWMGSYEQLKVSRRLESIAVEQLRDVDQLIEQHARAPVDRLPFAATAENVAADRAQAEQAMFGQQQNLWETLGLSAPKEHGLPEGDLPTPSTTPLNERAIAARAHRSASSRPLLASLSREIAAAETREEAARVAKRPDLNLVAQGSGGRVENYQTITQTDLGYYGGVALQFSLPIPNRAARGAHELAEQTRVEQELAAAQTRSGIDARIDALCDALATLSVTHAQRITATAQYEQEYQAERTRFRAGSATSLDVVLAEQQYMSSSRAVVVDRTAYAVALARLLYESGAIDGAVHARDAAEVARAMSKTNL